MSHKKEISSPEAHLEENDFGEESFFQYQPNYQFAVKNTTEVTTETTTRKEDNPTKYLVPERVLQAQKLKTPVKEIKEEPKSIKTPSESKKNIEKFESNKTIKATDPKKNEFTPKILEKTPESSKKIGSPSKKLEESNKKIESFEQEEFKKVDSYKIISNDGSSKKTEPIKKIEPTPTKQEVTPAKAKEIKPIGSNKIIEFFEQEEFKKVDSYKISNDGSYKKTEPIKKIEPTPTKQEVTPAKAKELKPIGDSVSKALKLLDSASNKSPRRELNEINPEIIQSQTLQTLERKTTPSLLKDSRKIVKDTERREDQITRTMTEKNWNEINKRVFNQEAFKEHECTRDYVEEIREETVGKYSDSIFMATDSSVHDNPKKKTYSGYNKWLRFSEIKKGKRHAIYESIDPLDINQGELGDCYFLSSLSSIAEKPERIIRLFEDQNSLNDKGIYFVKLCIDGTWRYVVLDDYMPCGKNNEPIFSKPSDENNVIEGWVLFLEKAWAKVFGSYETIDAGFTQDALFALTGAPCKRVETESSNAWESLVEANDKNWIMTGACGQDTLKSQQLTNVGLENAHAYSILNTYIIKHPKEGNVKLLEIRNPWGWGGTEWKGDWSDSWKGWPAEEKKRFNIPSDDGRFFMSFKDFMKFFDYVTVCMMNNDFYYVSYPIRSKKNCYSLRKFNLKKGGQTYLTVIQKDERYFRKMKYEYSPVRLLISKKIGENKFEYITGKEGACEKFLTLDMQLTAGEYYIAICIDYADKIYDLTLSYYGEEDIRFELIDYKKYPNLLDSMMLEGGERQLFMEEEKKDYIYECYYYNDELMLVEVFTNKTQKELNIQRDYSKIDSGLFYVMNTEFSETNKKFRIKVQKGEARAVCTKIQEATLDTPENLEEPALRSFGFRAID